MGGGIIVRIGATLILLGFAVLFTLAALGSNDILLRALNIPTMRPFFADLRTVPSVEQIALMDDIRAPNPSDPWGRAFNYPRIWIYLLQPFRVCGDPYSCFGGLQVLIYLSLVGTLIWRIGSTIGVVAILLVSVSPPITLLLERGNTDGLIFALVLMAVCRAGSFTTPFLIALAAGLKIYAVPALVVVYRPRDRLKFLMALAVTSPLLVMTFADLATIFAATPVSDRISYGISSFALLLGKLLRSVTGSSLSGELLLALSATAFLLTVLAAYRPFRATYLRLAERAKFAPLERSILLVFGIIFLSTMLVSGNWAYRIVFLGPIAVLTANWLFEAKEVFPPDRQFLAGFAMVQFGAFWSFLAPWGYLLFNAAALVAAALLLPLVALIVADQLSS